MGAMEAMQRRNKAASVAPIWTALDEPELVRRARSERGAFGELYRRHYDAIGAYLYRRIGCRHAAEDLLSEVFLSAMSAMPRFRGTSLRSTRRSSWRPHIHTRSPWPRSRSSSPV